MTGIERTTRGRPDRIQEIVANQNRDADDEACTRSEELRTRQDDHAGAEGPDHLQRHADQPIELFDSPWGQAPRRRNDKAFDHDEPRAAPEEEPAQRGPAPASRHQAGARPGEEHEDRRAECVIQRVKKSAAPIS